MSIFSQCSSSSIRSSKHTAKEAGPRSLCVKDPALSYGGGCRRVTPENALGGFRISPGAFVWPPLRSRVLGLSQPLKLCARACLRPSPWSQIPLLAVCTLHVVFHR